MNVCPIDVDSIDHYKSWVKAREQLEGGVTDSQEPVDAI